MPDAQIESNVISGRIIKNTNGEKLCVISNSTVKPLTSTVETLYKILLVVTSVMLVLALLMALIISRRISCCHKFLLLL